MTLIPGQNVPISGSSAYHLDLDIPGWTWGVIVFKNNGVPSMFHQEEGLAVSENQLLINLHDISDQLEKVMVYISCDDTEGIKESGKKNTLNINLVELVTSRQYVSITFCDDEHKEKALNVLELYKRNDAWKIRCVRQGFSGGLPKLFSSLGMCDKPTQPILNTKDINTDSLVDDAYIQMVWESNSDTAHASSMYVGEEFKPTSDLRIGCFYQLKNGQVGVAQSIGDEMAGSLHGVPYIRASRSLSKHFEQLSINLTYQHKLHKYLVYAIMYEGYDSWGGLRVSMAFNFPGMEKEVLSPNTLMKKVIYAAAMIDFSSGIAKVIPVNEFFHSLQEMDVSFGWGLPWRVEDK